MNKIYLQIGTTLDPWHTTARWPNQLKDTFLNLIFLNRNCTEKIKDT